MEVDSKIWLMYALIACILGTVTICEAVESPESKLYDGQLYDDIQEEDDVMSDVFLQSRSEDTDQTNPMENGEEIPDLDGNLMMDDDGDDDGEEERLLREELDGANYGSPSNVSSRVSSRGNKRYWKIVFRGAAGIGKEVYKAWTDGQGTSRRASGPIWPKKIPCSSHFRSRRVSNWDHLGVKFVRYSMIENQQEVAFVVFAARGCSLTSWFSHRRMIKSSWCDITGHTKHNLFSMAGDVRNKRNSNIKRRFMINTMYKGCKKDIGHLLTVDGKVTKGCLFDKQPSWPQFLYSKINSHDVWDRHQYGRADYMAISILT